MPEAKVVALPFELRSLEVFLSVCDHGTMSAAARSLGLTQSAVSQTVNDLEQRTKMSLFNRDVRPLGLTVSGVILRQRASALLADARQIGPLLQEVRRGRLPLIRVGLIDSLSRLLVPRLPDYLMQRADHVLFSSGLTSSHVDDILGRKLDILMGIDEFDFLDGLESWPLIEEPHLLIAPLGTSAPADLKDLVDLSRTCAFVRYHPRRKMGVSIDRHLRRVGLELPRTYEFDTPFGVAATVAKGNAWAITTPLCIFEAGDLVHKFACLPLPGPSFKRRLSLISRVRELARLPRETADFTVGLLMSELMPTIDAYVPWLAPSIVVGEQIRRRA
jgi:DNA-binding transcriptional LysR family regulator